MRVWYSKKWDMYAPTEDWYEDGGPDDWVEMEIDKEVIVCEGGDNDPYRHGERWQMEFYDDDANWMYSIGTKLPWKHGKYKITIERDVRDHHKFICVRKPWRKR